MTDLIENDEEEGIDLSEVTETTDKEFLSVQEFLTSAPQVDARTTLLNYFLPLLALVRKESLAYLNNHEDRLEEVEDSLDEEDDEGDLEAVSEDTMGFVTLLLTIIDTAFVRAGWLQQDGSLADHTPPELQSMFATAKVQAVKFMEEQKQLAEESEDG